MNHDSERTQQILLPILDQAHDLGLLRQLSDWLLLVERAHRRDRAATLMCAGHICKPCHPELVPMLEALAWAALLDQRDDLLAEASEVPDDPSELATTT